MRKSLLTALTAMTITASAAAPAAAEEFVSFWKPPKRMTNYDLRIASSKCKDQAKATHGDSFTRQGVFEACMRGLGAKLTGRTINGAPANGPVRRRVED